MADMTLCALPGGLEACGTCRRNPKGEPPKGGEFQSWMMPRKGLGTCQDQMPGSDKRDKETNG